MDTLSHAVWGWIALRQVRPAIFWWGALAGAAPDLLFYVPYAVEQVAVGGFTSLLGASDAGMWKLGGPPLPPIMAAAYTKYYVYSHSLVLLAAALAVLQLSGRRRWLWLGVPYAVHILMDIPTHERFAVQPFFPVSDWHFIGLSWGDPRIFWPHLAILVAALAWSVRRGRRPTPS